MGLLGKLAFWKRKDDFGDIGKDLGIDKDIGLDGPSPDLGLSMPQQQDPQAYQRYPSFQPNQNFQPAYQAPLSDSNVIITKNLEVLSSKLDALKATLDSMNQRIANIEAIARGEEQQQRRKYY